MPPDDHPRGAAGPCADRRLFVAAGAATGLACVAGLRADSRGTPGASDSARTQAGSPQPEEPGTLCSPRNAPGVGLRGEYFPRELLQGEPLLVRTDGVVDFDPALGWPATESDRPRSVRWSGWIKAALSGPHRFHCDHPHARLVVAHSDFSQAPRAAPATPPLNLTAGRFYPVEIRLDHLPGNHTGRIRLEWTPPHGVRFLVTRSVLFMPMA